MVTAVLRHSGVDPGRADAAMERSRLSGLLPMVRAGLRQGTGYDFLTRQTDTSGTSSLTASQTNDSTKFTKRTSGPTAGGVAATAVRSHGGSNAVIRFSLSQAYRPINVSFDVGFRVSSVTLPSESWTAIWMGCQPGSMTLVG